jgi:2-phospho-L-lactate guanylyltransferase
VSHTVALVPIRALWGGKTRLAATFDEHQRSKLVLALAQQLFEALEASEIADEVMILTADPALVRALGLHRTRFLTEVPPGLNAAVDAGRREALASGAERLLVVFPDLPEVGAEDLQAIDLSRAAVTIIPDRQHDGTNALLLQGAGIIRDFPFRYGPGSCQAHRDVASSLGEVASVLDVPAMAIDLDTDEDWRRLPAATRARLRLDIARDWPIPETQPVLMERS